MCLSYLVIVFCLVCTAYWGHGKQKCVGNSIHISGTRQQSHHIGASNLHSMGALGLEMTGCPHGGAGDGLYLGDHRQETNPSFTFMKRLNIAPKWLVPINQN